LLIETGATSEATRDARPAQTTDARSRFQEITAAALARRPYVTHESRGRGLEIRASLAEAAVNAGDGIARLCL